MVSESIGNPDATPGRALEQRVAKLEAIEEIRRLKTRYALLLETGYPGDQLAELFTHDAVWDSGDKFGVYTGRDQIREFFNGAEDLVSWAMHYMISPTIDVDSDLEHATGVWYLWQPCLLKLGESHDAVWITGIYHDSYRRENGTWLFSKVQMDFTAVSPYQDGFARRRFAL